MAINKHTEFRYKVWHYTYLTICGLVFFFLIAPLFVIIPLSFNAEQYIHFSDDMYGINLPKEDILKRSKFNWLAALNEEDTMKANINLVRYIKVSQVSDYLDNKKVISTYF